MKIPLVLAKYSAYASGASLLGVVAITVLHVAMVLVDRLFLSMMGISGIEEIVAMLSGFAFFMVLPFAQSEMVHVKADFIPWSRAVLGFSRVLSTLLFVCIYGALAFALTLGLFQAWDDGIVTSVLSIPHWPFYLPGIFACGLSSVVAFGQLFLT